MKADHERVTKLLTDTVTLLCKNGLSFDHELRIQGLLGITVDSNEVFLVSINDCFNCSSSSSPVSGPSLPISDTASNQSRKRSFDDIVDLTRLVETPRVHAEVQSSQLPSSISQLHHGAQTRPKSAGSVAQTRSRAVTPSSSNLSLAHHSQPVARQPPFGTVMTTGHPNTTTVRRNTAEHSMSANSQHGNALVSVDPSIMHPGQRPRTGYLDSIHNLMLACERQLAPRCCPHGQQRRQLPSAGPSGWTGIEQQHSMQLQPMNQNMVPVGALSTTAAGNLETVGRPAVEHFGFPSHPCRQAVPRNACVQRSDVNSSRYIYANTAVPHVVGPPPRQPCSDVSRPVYHDRSQYIGNLSQVNVTSAQGRQLVDNATMQPPAKRHTQNHLPRQAVQSFNPASMQSHFSHPRGYSVHSDSTSVSQQAYFVAEPHAMTSLPLSNTSASQACITSSPVIKPPSSPVQSGRRLRPRQVEHIDLCDDDDETADSGIHIPMSSIVIQPDNIDILAAPDEAQTSNMVSVNAFDLPVSELEPVPENSYSGTSLPPLTRILEIVPLDDVNDLEGGEVSAARNTVAVENARQSASASRSAAVGTSELSDSRQNTASSHQDSELSATHLDVSRDLVGMFSHTFTDSQLEQLSADEITQMAELCFDSEGNAQM